MCTGCTILPTQLYQCLACIRDELYTPAKSALSPRSPSHAPLAWCLQGPIENVDPTLPYFLELASTIRVAFRANLKNYTVYVGASILSSLPNGIQGNISCNQQGNFRYHYPFFVQANCSEYLEHLKPWSCLSLWIVQNALLNLDKNTFSALHLSMLPCMKCGEVSSKIEWSLPNYDVNRDQNPSLSRIDSRISRVLASRIRQFRKKSGKLQNSNVV